MRVYDSCQLSCFFSFECARFYQKLQCDDLWSRLRLPSQYFGSVCDHCAFLSSQASYFRRPSGACCEAMTAVKGWFTADAQAITRAQCYLSSFADPALRSRREDFAYHCWLVRSSVWHTSHLNAPIPYLHQMVIWKREEWRAGIQVRRYRLFPWLGSLNTDLFVRVLDTGELFIF